MRRLEEEELRKELDELNRRLEVLERVLEERDKRWENIPLEALEEAVGVVAIAKLFDLMAEYLEVPKEVISLGPYSFAEKKEEVR